jgi:hypothetical protein
LREACDNAKDCAGKEINQKSVSDYGILPPTPGISGNSEGAMDIIQSTKVAASVFLPFLARSDSTIKLQGLFEPLLIEFLSLQKEIHTPSIWDRVPVQWKRFRNFGFSSTKYKLEALWAYLKVHEKILHDSAIIDRFPEFQNCFQRVIKEAKADLDVLQNTQPRRFFYCKHLLALRHILQGRLHKLEGCLKKGWIDKSDAEALLDAVRERINLVDVWMPSRITEQTWMNTRHGASAWSDLVLPETGGNPSLSGSEVSVGKKHSVEEDVVQAMKSVSQEGQPSSQERPSNAAMRPEPVQSLGLSKEFEEKMSTEDSRIVAGNLPGSCNGTPP